MKQKEATKATSVTLDAKDQILGRLAVRVADALRGKNSADFLHYKDAGNAVVVFNTDKIKVSGNKLEGKIYYRHSGYPGGIKEEKLGDVMKKDSRIVLRRAVYGMLPKNKLRDRFITRLFLFKEDAPKKITEKPE